MNLWTTAILVGILAIGLGRERSSRRAHGLVILVILVVIGYQALKYHAI